MAINKITNEQRELMRQKSAQSLPDVPSSKGWTPKNFKDAMTKPLFDNENSFFAFYNALVEQVENIKFDKEDYDFKNLGQFATERAFASACEDDYYASARDSKNFAYKGYIVDSASNQYTAFGLAGHRNSAGQSFDSMVITQKGITCYQQGNEVNIVLNKIETSDVRVNTNIEVPAPVGNANAVNKYYLEENHYNKNEIDSSLQSVETNLNYNIQGALDSSKSYTDLKYNQLKSVLDTILEDAPTAYDTLKEIADYIASDITGASAMLSQINNNTSEINVIKQGLPTTVDIILRSEVSEGTTEEAKEMEINGMKFKIGSATSSDSALKLKLVASGTLEYDENSGVYSSIYNFENNKMYAVTIQNTMYMLGYCENNMFLSQIVQNQDESKAIYIQSYNNSYDSNTMIFDLEDNIVDWYDGYEYRVYELVAPVGSGSGRNVVEIEGEVLYMNDGEEYIENIDEASYIEFNFPSNIIDIEKPFKIVVEQEDSFTIFVRTNNADKIYYKTSHDYVRNSEVDYFCGCGFYNASGEINFIYFGIDLANDYFNDPNQTPKIKIIGEAFDDETSHYFGSVEV